MLQKPLIFLWRISLPEESYKHKALNLSPFEFIEGELLNLKVYKSSGNKKADDAALKAVRASAPFKDFPSDCKKNIDVQFSFDYNVFGAGGKKQ